MATKINKNKVIAAAQKFVQKGQYDKAIKEYARIVEEDPRDVRIWLKIGDLHAKRNSPQEAIDTYAKVAEFYSEQGFYLKAVAVYKQILKIDSGLVDYNLKLAELYKQLGLLSDAMHQYEQVSNHFHQAGRTKEALAALRQIVDLDPENVASRIKLAELYSKEGHRAEAVEEFSKAADFLRAENRLDDFVKVAERLIFHQPENLGVTKELAGIYLRKGDPRRALQKLQLAFKADPRDEETLVMLAQSFEDLGQVQKTIPVLKELARIHTENGNEVKRQEINQRILNLAPNDEEARQALGQAKPAVKFDTGFDGAVAPERPPRLDPSFSVGEPYYPKQEEYHPRQTYGRGETARGSEELEEVSSSDFIDFGIEEVPAQVERETDIDEEVAKILTEADVYIKYGLHEKAVDHLRQVFTRDPQNTQVRLKLRDLYMQLGRYAEAARELLFRGRTYQATDVRRAASFLNEALELDSENEEARALLSQLEGSGSAADEGPEYLEEESFTGSVSIDLEAEDIVEEIPIEAMDEMGSVLEEQYITAGGDTWSESADYSNPFSDEDYASGRHAITGTDQLDEGPGSSGIIELRGEVTDTLGGGTPSSEVIPLGVELQPSASQLKIRQEEESTSIEDDLEEAEFFIQQNLMNEARSILAELLHRSPNNGLVQSKLAEIDVMIASEAGSVPSSLDEGPLIGELSGEFEEVERSKGGQEEPVFSVQDVFDEFKRGAGAEVADEDSDTHYDLGIAYREMGLMDDAIAEFKVAMRSREKEVLCHMMIGLCFVEKDMLSEAISQFKTGLYVEGITDRETIALYFELGLAYEKIEDYREALYYYEKVTKKDPRFRNVAGRIESLRSIANSATGDLRVDSSENSAGGEEDPDLLSKMV